MVVGIRQTSSAVRTRPGLVARRCTRRTGRASRTTTTKIDRQRGQQDVQRDLVRRALPLGALDEGDHPVDERLPGTRGDPHHDLVREHHGAAGDGRAVAAGLPDHRRRLTGHRGLVDRRDALDDVAVTGDPSPARPPRRRRAQGRARHLVDRERGQVAGVGELVDGPRTRRAVVSAWSARRLAACALPRPSATDSARVPKSTVSHSQTVTSNREDATGPRGPR